MRTDVTENMQPYVIIVEDDERLAELTAEYLRSNGMKIDVIGDGNEAIDAIIDNQPDMVVLDLMLPGADGLEVCKSVRDRYKKPILMLTARTDDVDQVLGLMLPPAVQAAESRLAFTLWATEPPVHV